MARHPTTSWPAIWVPRCRAAPHRVALMLPALVPTQIVGSRPCPSIAGISWARAPAWNAPRRPPRSPPQPPSTGHRRRRNPDDRLATALTCYPRGTRSGTRATRARPGRRTPPASHLPAPAYTPRHRSALGPPAAALARRAVAISRGGRWIWPASPTCSLALRCARRGDPHARSDVGVRGLRAAGVDERGRATGPRDRAGYSRTLAIMIAVMVAALALATTARSKRERRRALSSPDEPEQARVPSSKPSGPGEVSGPGLAGIRWRTADAPLAAQSW